LTGLVCAPYHAGLKDCDREDAQRKWTDGVIQIAVATIAFGMGIDLPHVRYVIHWTMARSLEGFYQE
jgi:superfamily II DNA helicase RecQ